jgi:hypothetical protein
MALGFPGARYSGMNLNTFGYHHSNTHVREHWKRIRTGRTMIDGNVQGVRPTTGQLVVVINNRQRSYPAQLHQTIMSVSAQFAIKPRPQAEWAILEEVLFTDFGSPHYQKRDVERIIQRLTPGTLQNLLRYQLLLWELRDGIRGEPRMSGTRVLAILARIESFLKPLHEIERENLKRRVCDVLTPRWIESRMKDYSEAHWERFIEVFGETPAPVILPHVLREGILSFDLFPIHSSYFIALEE